MLAVKRDGSQCGAESLLGARHCFHLLIFIIYLIPQQSFEIGTVVILIVLIKLSLREVK